MYNYVDLQSLLRRLGELSNYFRSYLYSVLARHLPVAWVVDLLPGADLILEGISKPPRCSSLQSLHPFFSEHTFFGVTFLSKSSILVLSVESTLFQNASGFSMFSLAYFRHFILCWGRSFWQLCNGGLCCSEYVVVLSWTATPVFATLFCCSFAVMCGFFWAFLTRSLAILSEIFLRLLDLALTSTVAFIFRFLIILLTVEIGSLKHRESFCIRLILGGNEPSSFWNYWTAVQSQTEQPLQLDTLEVMELLQNKKLNPGIILTWRLIQALTSKSPGSGPSSF